MMTDTTNFFDNQFVATERPIFREAFAGFDWLALRASPIYYGLGVSRGDGSAVIIVPGFLGTDYYMMELYFWLCRVGYKPYLSGIGWNANCLDKLANRLTETVERAAKKTKRPVHLIGHSLGGILSRSVANQSGENVASVITLGSPFRGIHSHPLVQQTAEQVRNFIIREQSDNRPECFTGNCTCETVKANKSPLRESIKQTAIYTKTDGIVDWKMCLSEDSKSNYEVSGTHIGLVFNPQVYALIAKRLRQVNKTT